MNRKIKKLAEEAGFKFGQSTAANESWQEQKLEKFAELIMQECLSLQKDLRSSGWDNQMIEDETKEHFGVK